MKDNPLIGILLAVLAILFLSEIITLSIYSRPNSEMKPGLAVAVLLNETIIYEGHPCRVNLIGFISATGPDNESRRYKPNSWWFPRDTHVAVIYLDGSVYWEAEKQIVLLPANPDLMLCPPSNGG